MIRSRRNETLKAIRRLRRRQGDHLLLEGPHLLDEALRRGIEIESTLVTPRFRADSRWQSLLARLERPPLEVEEALLDELLDSDSPRGVLALGRRPTRDAGAIPIGRDAVIVYLDGVQDPGNLGAIARVAEAFDVAALALGPGCAHPHHPRAQRAAAGSLLRLPVARIESPGAVAERLAPVAPTWVALEAHGGIAPGAARRGALVLVVGAEGGGVSAAAAGLVSERWTIPISPRVESLNVAVATGVALYALRAGSAAR